MPYHFLIVYGRILYWVSLSTHTLDHLPKRIHTFSHKRTTACKVCPLLLFCKMHIFYLIFFISQKKQTNRALTANVYAIPFRNTDMPVTIVKISWNTQKITWKSKRSYSSVQGKISWNQKISCKISWNQEISWKLASLLIVYGRILYCVTLSTHTFDHLQKRIHQSLRNNSLQGLP